MLMSRPTHEYLSLFDRCCFSFLSLKLGTRTRGELQKMGQVSFVYSFVARGTVVLAEYTELIGNFPAIATRCLDRLPASNKKFTYNYERHNFDFLAEDGYAYCIVAKESVGNQISVAFLERLKADFKKRYGGGKADTADAKSLNKEFGPVMKEHMQYIIDHAEEINRQFKVQDQVSQLKNIMQENITKVIERGENLNDLSDKAHDLRDSAEGFKKVSDQIKRKMWYQNMKTKLIVVVILLVLALIIWLSICHGFKCT
ncbi:Vesicle-associated membrane protein 724 [Camellia lanceoleosa]|uniref:Vesicle-associated membrane protein 724 n=1 Tax=Camellia lanceoleosa TaxID=1840588 RepID=A0ACC0HFU8_9ERIC|nr:Vesicle-associated membrane protein 724 [Camellia lanceoleosa]